jgi:hypothetical protein
VPSHLAAQQAKRVIIRVTTITNWYRIVEPTLFVTDAELIRRIGVPEKIARAAIHALDPDKAGHSTEASAMGKPPLLACGAGLV